MSEQKKIIAVDAMSGDKGPSAVLGGINQFLYQNGEDKVQFRLFGDEKRLRRMLTKYPRVGRNVEVVHAPDVIKGTDKIMDIITVASNEVINKIDSKFESKYVLSELHVNGKIVSVISLDRLLADERFYIKD